MGVGNKSLDIPSHHSQRPRFPQIHSHFPQILPLCSSVSLYSLLQGTHGNEVSRLTLPNVFSPLPNIAILLSFVLGVIKADAGPRSAMPLLLQGTERLPSHPKLGIHFVGCKVALRKSTFKTFHPAEEEGGEGGPTAIALRLLLR